MTGERRHRSSLRQLHEQGRLLLVLGRGIAGEIEATGEGVAPGFSGVLRALLGGPVLCGEWSMAQQYLRALDQSTPAQFTDTIACELERVQAEVCSQRDLKRFLDKHFQADHPVRNALPDFVSERFNTVLDFNLYDPGTVYEQLPHNLYRGWSSLDAAERQLNDPQPGFYWTPLVAPGRQEFILGTERLLSRSLEARSIGTAGGLFRRLLSDFNWLFVGVEPDDNVLLMLNKLEDALMPDDRATHFVVFDEAVPLPRGAGSRLQVVPRQPGEDYLTVLQDLFGPSDAGKAAATSQMRSAPEAVESRESPPTATPADQPAPPRTLDYEVVQDIKRPLVQQVRRGDDLDPGRLYARKLAAGGDAERIATLQRETALLRLLADAGVVPLIDEGWLPDGGYYFTMPFYANGTLGRRFDTYAGRPPERLEQRLAILVELAEILRRVHAKRVVHGDLWLSNVLLDDMHRPILADFGGAVPLDTAEPPRRRVDYPYLHYPPERRRGDAWGLPADIFALGGICNQLCCGKIAPGERDYPAHWQGLMSLAHDMLAPDPQARPTAAIVCERLRTEVVDRTRFLEQFPEPGGTFGWVRESAWFVTAERRRCAQRCADSSRSLQQLSDKNAALAAQVERLRGELAATAATAAPPVRIELRPIGVPRGPTRDPAVWWTAPAGGFELAVLPTSNREFADFLKTDAGARWRRGEVGTADYLWYWTDDLIPGTHCEDLPVFAITAEAAGAYADWRGLRLPTEAEWLTALWRDRARAPTEPNPCTAVFGNESELPPPPPLTDCYRTTHGLLHLAGLIWEYCRREDGRLVGRGGCWSTGARYMGTDYLLRPDSYFDPGKGQGRATRRGCGIRLAR